MSVGSKMGTGTGRMRPRFPSPRCCPIGQPRYRACPSAPGADGSPSEALVARMVGQTEKVGEASSGVAQELRLRGEAQQAARCLGSASRSPRAWGRPTPAVTTEQHRSGVRRRASSTVRTMSASNLPGTTHEPSSRITSCSTQMLRSRWFPRCQGGRPHRRTRAPKARLAGASPPTARPAIGSAAAWVSRSDPPRPLGRIGIRQRRRWVPLSSRTRTRVQPTPLGSDGLGGLGHRRLVRR